MKRAKYILTTLFALTVILAEAFPVYAADAEPGTSSSYYPISVEEYTYGDFDELRINKVYQLSLADDPSLIPTEDFVRNGRLYYLLDMTRKDEVGVDTQPYTQTVTMASDTDSMEAILQKLEAEIEATTEDGYTGVLRLDHTSVQVTVDGYATKSRTISATRTYPNLSDADLSLVPKTITDGGKTLTLADVQWSSSNQTEADGTVVRYCATASYTGTSSSRYATGYTVTANYSGEVARTGCNVVTYTAIFGSMPDPNGTAEPETPDSTNTPDVPDSPDTPNTPDAPASASSLKKPLLIGGVVIVLAAGGVFAFKKWKERR